jgi:hypothetical protein
MGTTAFLDASWKKHTTIDGIFVVMSGRLKNGEPRFKMFGCRDNGQPRPVAKMRDLTLADLAIDGCHVHDCQAIPVDAARKVLLACRAGDHFPELFAMTAIDPALATLPEGSWLEVVWHDANPERRVWSGRFTSGPVQTGPRNIQYEWSLSHETGEMGACVFERLAGTPGAVPAG